MLTTKRILYTLAIYLLNIFVMTICYLIIEILFNLVPVIFIDAPITLDLNIVQGTIFSIIILGIYDSISHTYSEVKQQIKD